MRIFCDFHHAGMAQGIYRLFHDRLGHDVMFPSNSFCYHVTEQYKPKDGGALWTMASELPWTWCGCDDMPHLIGRDEFLNFDWDMIIVSRTESQQVFRDLLKAHSNCTNVRVLGVHGNQGGGYDYEWVRDLITSDLSTLVLAPDSLNVLHYSQEIGKHFFGEYVPVEPSGQHTVNCFMNFLTNYREPYYETGDADVFGYCPHCHMSMDDDGWWAPIERCSPNELWWKIKADLAQSDASYQMKSYGLGCDDCQIPNQDLPKTYQFGALTWHYKHVEGYGFSMLQSIAIGRPVLVQEKFYRYRTAGRYLIPGLTCFETSWDAKEIADLIRWYTYDLDRVNQYGAACHRAAQGLFNWDHEAYRVNEFLEGRGE